MNRSDPWPKLLVCLFLAGLATAWLGGETLRLTAPGSWERLVDTMALAAGGAALFTALLILARHFRALNRREGETATESRPFAPDIAAVAAVAALPAVLRCLDRPALVVSERGRILQANPAAATFLDPLGRPGDDIGEVVDRDDWRYAVAKARSTRQATDALLRRRDGLGDLAARVGDLGFQAGAVVVFTATAADERPRPPARPGGRWGVAVDPAHPPASLPIVALRVVCAGGGDDAPAAGRVTEIETMKLTGGRVFPTLSLEFNVAQPDLDRPGRPFVEVWPILSQALVGAVVVAENAAGAWTALQRELTAAGFAVVEPPPLIDLARLAAAYDPTWRELSADALAQNLGVADTPAVRRLARVAAALVLGRDGGGLGIGVGEFVGRSGDNADDAVKPAASAPAAGD